MKIVECIIVIYRDRFSGEAFEKICKALKGRDITEENIKPFLLLVLANGGIKMCVSDFAHICNLNHYDKSNWFVISAYEWDY